MLTESEHLNLFYHRKKDTLKELKEWILTVFYVVLFSIAFWVFFYLLITGMRDLAETGRI